MPTADEPAFYPTTELEAHGLAPDTWSTAAVYALALDVPGVDAFREAWHSVYEIAPPHSLAAAVGDGRELAYVGAAKDLRARLADHLTRERNRVKLLAVCPPVGVLAVWPEASIEDALDHEFDRALAFSQDNPGTRAWCNGELL